MLPETQAGFAGSPSFRKSLILAAFSSRCHTARCCSLDKTKRLRGGPWYLLRGRWLHSQCFSCGNS